MSQNASRKLSQELELICCCYHEAAHAIYALLACIKPITAEVNKSRKVSGFIKYTTPIDYSAIENKNLLRKLVESEVGLLYSGIIAEELFYQYICGIKRLPNILRQGSSSDNIKANKLISNYKLVQKNRSSKNFKSKLKKKIVKKLQKHWKEIRLLAHFLYLHRKLNYLKLKYILIKSPYWKKKFHDIELISTCPKELDPKKIRIIISNIEND